MAEMSCIFCKIANNQTSSDTNITELVYEDENIVAFKDIRPATNHHYLVIPKQHVGNPKALGPDHLGLITRLQEVGQSILEEKIASSNPEDNRFGYHWPPFNSIQHLHLHAIGDTSSMGLIAKGIYLRNSPWFVTHQWLVDRLENLKD